MSIVRQVLVAAYEAGIEDAEMALREHDRLQNDVIKMFAEDGDTIAVVIRSQGQTIDWRAPAPFFAAAVSRLTVTPFEAQATRLEDA